jgi:hypothetical protein
MTTYSNENYCAHIITRMPGVAAFPYDDPNECAEDRVSGGCSPQLHVDQDTYIKNALLHLERIRRLTDSELIACVDAIDRACDAWEHVQTINSDSHFDTEIDECIEYLWSKRDHEYEVYEELLCIRDKCVNVDTELLVDELSKIWNAFHGKSMKHIETHS